MFAAAIAKLEPVTTRPGLWLFRVAVAILILNLIDGVLTLALIQSGLATEANPMMAELLGHGAVHFMLFKISLVSLSVLLLWRLQRQRVAVLALYAAAGVYGLLAVYHLQSINMLAQYLS